MRVEQEENMKGKITKFLTNKGFGFIEPEDGQGDVFMPPRSWVAGYNPKPNDEVEYELDTARKGKSRAAKNVRLASSSATSYSPAPSEAKGGKEELKKATPTSTQAPVRQIAADPDLDPDSKGRFRVSICTRDKAGKPHEMNFRAIVLQGEKVKFFKKNGAGFTEVGNLDLRTGSSGRLELYLKFAGEQATVKFELDNAQCIVSDFTK